MKRCLILLVICLMCMSLVAMADSFYPLPVDDSPGNEPNPDAFTETTYQDESITVAMETYREYDATFNVARVSIKSPTQIRTALAGAYGTTKTNKTSNLAKKYHAVVAMNGDYYANRSAGYIVRQGETYRKKPVKGKDLLIIDDLGDFHILKNSNAKELEAIIKSEREIINSFTFGPALVIDGALQEMPESYEFNIRGKEPRSAIGQLDTLTYLLVVVDGRSDENAGVTVAQLAEFMQKMGCKQAFNMDGGNTATLVFNNRLFCDKTTDSERAISDIIYFASAVGSDVVIAE